MQYSLEHIARILSATVQGEPTLFIRNLAFDSRRVHSHSDTLFFAIKGERRDGHRFLPSLYQAGVRAFVVSENMLTEHYPGACFLNVLDPVKALQSLAAAHRKNFMQNREGHRIPVIGITGSNGKTVVKEWLWQLLHDQFTIVRSPGSYNSQIGVPMSVWQMDVSHNLAIFEAGISAPGEMQRLEQVIQPVIGVLTNIGDAHSEGFTSLAAKFSEKLKLFQNCRIVIGREADFAQSMQASVLAEKNMRFCTWGFGKNNEFVIRSVQTRQTHTDIIIACFDEECSFSIPFTDEASAENAITCFCIAKKLGLSCAGIAMRMKNLQPVQMRLELKQGINHCLLINDSYSSDPDSLEIALNFLERQKTGMSRTVILSDFAKCNVPADPLYRQIFQKLRDHKVNRVICIGPTISAFAGLFAIPGDELRAETYPDTDSFINTFLSTKFKEEMILVKGARQFAFEKIVQLLELKSHQTMLEINLSALAHNLKTYQKWVQPAVKIMAMVKAFAYGNGAAEIASMLQYHHADYLGVAYADEGVELRKAGIHLPVMIMNPEPNAFEKILEYRLEPEMFSLRILSTFDLFLKQQGVQSYPVHLELETGMNRLGFSTEELAQLIEAINGTSSFRIMSVFTHLAAAEEVSNDEFTKMQFEKFKVAASLIEKETGHTFIKHIANSAAAVRHPEMQLDMVRLGIGLYGVESSGSGRLILHPIATLKSTVSRIRKLGIGETVSYNRKGIICKESVIATVRLGYADGFSRRLGNGAGSVLIKGKNAPVIGTVCMDMFMADITEIPDVREGDEVIIFGPGCPVEKMAHDAGTIPYEILTAISHRVKRVFFEE